MFYDVQNSNTQNEYKQLLTLIGALSRLSTDSNTPYLYYRMAENIFCKAFNATNLARSDISIDAAKGDFGIGLKTFLYKNGNCIEKIAEFNKQRNLFANMDDNNLIHTIASLRNERISTTVDITGVTNSNLLYHCVARSKNKFHLYETSMDLIDIHNIQHIHHNTDNTIYFDDNLNEYCFNIAKSTLLKKFTITNTYDFEVPIIDDPYELLYNVLRQPLGLSSLYQPNTASIEETCEKIILPLYSKQNGIKKVPERSGLNQWNASGRERDVNEIYIPIPSWINHNFPDFFPDRNTPFNLILPNSSRTTLSAKVCQDNNKALMSNPNRDLGNWLLRQVLRIPEGELLTYNTLERKGIDSIEITKSSNNSYFVNFKQLGSFEDFELANK